MLTMETSVYIERAHKAQFNFIFLNHIVWPLNTESMPGCSEVKSLICLSALIMMHLCNCGYTNKVELNRSVIPF